MFKARPHSLALLYCARSQFQLLVKSNQANETSVSKLENELDFGTHQSQILDRTKSLSKVRDYICKVSHRVLDEFGTQIHQIVKEEATKLCETPTFLDLTAAQLTLQPEQVLQSFNESFEEFSVHQETITSATTGATVDKNNNNILQLFISKLSDLISSIKNLFMKFFESEATKVGQGAKATEGKQSPKMDTLKLVVTGVSLLLVVSYFIKGSLWNKVNSGVLKMLDSQIVRTIREGIASLAV